MGWVLEDLLKIVQAKYALIFMLKAKRFPFLGWVVQLHT